MQNNEAGNGPAQIKPTIRALNADQIDRIHRDALDILAKTGIRVVSDRARRLFQKAVGPTLISGETVRLPATLVNRSLELAPEAIDIYDRDGAKAMRLPGQARFGPGVTCLYYQDPQTEKVVPFGRREVATAVGLGQALASFDFMSTPGVLPALSPPGVEDAFSALEMIANTRKPLVLLVSQPESLSPVLDLLTHLHGDLRKKPFVMPLLSAITPLVLDEGTSERMFVAIERGLPVIYLNLGMAGVNTPITPYSAITLLIAELLAGITLSQLIQPGSPIIAGALGASMDMKRMVHFYDPTSYLMNLVCAEMMAHYRIPHYGTSGNAVGWGADLVAAGNQWFNHITACMGTTGMAAFVGTVLTSKVFSPEVVVYADEVIAQARRFANGFATDDSRLLAEEVARAGPGGSFLGSDSTLQHFRSASFNSRIFPNLSLEEWQARGGPKAETYLREYTVALIENLVPPDDHHDLITEGEDYIRKHWA